MMGHLVFVLIVVCNVSAGFGGYDLPFRIASYDKYDQCIKAGNQIMDQFGIETDAHFICVPANYP